MRRFFVCNRFSLVLLLSMVFAAPLSFAKNVQAARLSLVESDANPTDAVDSSKSADSIGSTLVAVANDSYAQFDPETLKARGINPLVGEYFRRSARFSPGAQLVGFVVNGNEMGRKTAQFNNAGKLCFTPSLVRSLGLKSLEQFESENPGATTDASCPEYRDYSPRTLVALRPNEASIELTVPQEDLVAVSRASRTETGGIGALFNYRGYAYESRYSGGGSANYRYADTVLGFNAGDWLMRSRQMYTANGGDSRLRWQAAYAQKTFVDVKQVLQVGRIMSNSSLYAGIPITGAQWFPERGLRQLLSYPVSGIAATRARVEIRQNGVLLYSTVVPAGPFTLSDYPLNNKAADLQVLVLEETGNQQVITVPASSLLLANDNTQNEGFSVAAGQLWDQTDRRTYDRVPLVTASYGWAVGPASGSVGGMFAEKYGSAGVAANWRVAPAASLFAQFVASRDNGRGLTGAQGSAAMGWQTTDALSLGVSGNLRSRDYRTIQDAASIYQGPVLATGTRTQLGATGSWNLGSWGAVSAGITRENYFAGDTGYLYSLSWGTSWKRINFQVGVSRNTAHTYLSDPAQPQSSLVLQRPNNYAYFTVSIPLGSSATTNTYAHRSNDVTRYGTSINQRVTDTVSYQASVEKAGGQPGTDSSASVTVVPMYTSLTLGVSDRQGGSSRYAEVAGSAQATAAGLAFSPYQVGDTFGSVKTGDIAGIRIETPQGPVWSGLGGIAAVPSLVAYRESRLETDLKRAPLDVDVDNPMQVIQAGRGAVINVDFGAVRVKRVLLAVKDAKGEYVAEGLPVLRGGDEFFSTSASRGQVMVSRMVEGDMIYVELAPGKRCLIQDIQTRPRQDGELFENGTATCK